MFAVRTLSPRERARRNLNRRYGRLSRYRDPRYLTFRGAFADRRPLVRMRIPAMNAAAVAIRRNTRRNRAATTIQRAFRAYQQRKTAAQSPLV